MSQDLLPLLVHLVCLAVFVVVCIKGKIRWAGFLVLLGAAIQSIVITLLLLFSNPLAARIVADGGGDPLAFYFPLGVAAILLVLAILTAVYGKRDNSPPVAAPAWLRWVGLVGSWLIVVIGLTLSLIALFAPIALGLGAPSPKVCFLAYSASLVPACSVIYLISAMNSPQYPNLMRWIAFLMIAAGLNTYPLVLSLLLIFSYPGQQTVEVLVYSALLSAAYVPPALVVLGIAKDYVRINAASAQ